MNCDTCRDLIPLALVGELTEHQRRELDEHLKTCDDCGIEWETMRQTVDRLAPDPRDSLTDIEKLRLENGVLTKLLTERTRFAHDRPSRAVRTGRVLLRLAAAVILFALGYVASPQIAALLGEPARSAAVPEATPCIQVDAGTAAGYRFSARGFRVLAHGRAAVTEEIQQQSR
jgi:anti-sigma factor RsiW